MGGRKTDKKLGRNIFLWLKICNQLHTQKAQLGVRDAGKPRQEERRENP